MAGRIRLHNWAATALGPLSGWPQPLLAAVSLYVRSQFPIMIHWSWPDLIVLYNDAFIPLIGDEHPTALGTRLFDSWPELRQTIENMLERVFSPGQAELSKDLLHVYRRMIGYCGCAITSVVVSLRYFGIATDTLGNEVNPKNLNTWLTNHGGYDTSTQDIVWGAVERYASSTSGSIVFDASSTDYDFAPASTTRAKLDSYLNSSTLNSVILGETADPPPKTNPGKS